MFSTCDPWAHCEHLVSGITMFSACSHQVLRPLPPVCFKLRGCPECFRWSTPRLRRASISSPCVCFLACQETICGTKCEWCGISSVLDLCRRMTSTTRPMGTLKRENQRRGGGLESPQRHYNLWCERPKAKGKTFSDRLRF